jgi:hypothetical protein
MAAAAAAAAGNGGMHDHSAYPAVLRDALAQVPAQAGGVQQMYPTIQPGGVASQFNAAAAAAGGDQVCTHAMLWQRDADCLSCLFFQLCDPSQQTAACLS